MAKFRKGDVVKVQGIVESDLPSDDDQIWLKIDDRSLFVSPDLIEIVRPVLNAGDRVKYHGNVVKLIAIHGDYAWIDFGAAQEVVLLTDLRRWEAPVPKRELAHA